MIVNIHEKHCGITLYVDHSLIISSAEEQLEWVLDYAKLEMQALLQRHKDNIWWERFLKYCHTGR